MLTLKLHYIIRINKRTLPCIALSLYLLQEMIYAIFSIAFGWRRNRKDIYNHCDVSSTYCNVVFSGRLKGDVKDFYVLIGR